MDELLFCELIAFAHNIAILLIDPIWFGLFDYKLNLHLFREYAHHSPMSNEPNQQIYNAIDCH